MNKGGKGRTIKGEAKSERKRGKERGRERKKKRGKERERPRRSMCVTNASAFALHPLHAQVAFLALVARLFPTSPPLSLSTLFPGFPAQTDGKMNSEEAPKSIERSFDRPAA